MVALLLEYKADPDLPWTDNFHTTPLYIASERTTLKWLPCYWSTTSTLTNLRVMVPLRFISLQKGTTLKLVAQLLEYNADSDKPRPVNAHATPLYIASESSHP